MGQRSLRVANGVMAAGALIHTLSPIESQDGGSKFPVDESLLYQIRFFDPRNVLQQVKALTD
jgi:hypothetical protein